jgi:hypothetical protein
MFVGVIEEKEKFVEDDDRSKTKGEGNLIFGRWQERWNQEVTEGCPVLVFSG